MASRTSCLLIGDSLRVHRLRQEVLNAFTDPAMNVNGAPDAADTSHAAENPRVQYISPALTPEDICHLPAASIVVVASAESLPISSAAAVCAHFKESMLLIAATTGAEVPSILWDHCPVAIMVNYQLDLDLVRSAATTDGLAALSLPQEVPPALSQETVGAAIAQLGTAGIANFRIILGALRVARYFSATVSELVDSYIIHPRVATAGLEAPPPAEPQPPEQDSTTEPPNEPSATEQSPQSETEEPTSADMPDTLSSADPPSLDAGNQPAPAPEDDASAESPAAEDAPEHLPEGDSELLPPAPRPGRSHGASGGSGRSGNLELGMRGRPRHPRPLRQDNEPLALAATLRAAAPWQRVRRAQNPQHPHQVLVNKEDMRTVDRLAPAGELILIIVDASGSMAAKALRTARSTAVALLEKSYRDRSEVGIIVAQGTQAFIGLAPTRSTKKARECLASLPAAGGTPLASARMLAAQIARSSSSRMVRVIELSDGRANVPLNSPDPLPVGNRPALRRLRAQAKADAQQAAQHLESVVDDFQTIPLGKRRR
ncbi:MAG: VWA domain-containing protein [Corynebacterium sp.]|nr:VWA domain-containing protein [Corynebacterium sp.]